LRPALHVQIAAALVLAAAAGLLIKSPAAISVYDFFGDLFINALKMLIVPLVFSSIISGIMGLPDPSSIKSLTVRTICYYLVTTLLATVVGLAAVNLAAPGMVDGEPARQILGLSADTASISKDLSSRGVSDVLEIFKRMVPPNIVHAAAEGQMLGLIFFAVVFGCCGLTLPQPHRQRLGELVEAVFRTMMKMTEIVLLFAPIGVFALVAKVVAKTGLSALMPLMTFFFTVLGALAFHAFVVLPGLLLLRGINPLDHFRNMAPALLTAFSTASSSATLPVTMECVEKRAGVPNQVSSFVIPLGATINMDGTALYECVAAMFIAQACGVEIGPVQQFSVVIIALLTSIGVAGIPAASLVAIAIILGSLGLPEEAIGPILAVDRILDMCRTSVNVFSDSCGAVIVAKDSDIQAARYD